jgi:hypothetical protein
LYCTKYHWNLTRRGFIRREIWEWNDRFERCSLRLVRLTGAGFGLKNLGILLSPSCRRDSITPEEVASLISSSGEIRVPKRFAV